ncbi:unnamed protein product [Closterium sp. NIES-65]|nr:unnamed protein product [Closterium sp. NIES-65]
MASYSSVAPARGVNLGSKSCATSGGKTVMKFTRGVGDGGSVPVRVKGINKIIWGYSTNGGKSVAYHGSNIGSTQVNFACNGASPGKPSPSPPGKKATARARGAALPALQALSLPAGALAAGEPEGGVHSVLYALLVHWRQVNKNVIELAMEAKPGSGANNGWLSLAWSSKRQDGAG